MCENSQVNIESNQLGEIKHTKKETTPIQPRTQKPHQSVCETFDQIHLIHFLKVVKKKNKSKKQKKVEQAHETAIKHEQNDIQATVNLWTTKH